MEKEKSLEGHLKKIDSFSTKDRTLYAAEKGLEIAESIPVVGVFFKMLKIGLEQIPRDMDKNLADFFKAVATKLNQLDLEVEEHATVSEDYRYLIVKTTNQAMREFFKLKRDMLANILVNGFIKEIQQEFSFEENTDIYLSLLDQMNISQVIILHEIVKIKNRAKELSNRPKVHFASLLPEDMKGDQKLLQVIMDQLASNGLIRNDLFNFLSTMTVMEDLEKISTSLTPFGEKFVDNVFLHYNNQTL